MAKRHFIIWLSAVFILIILAAVLSSCGDSISANTQGYGKFQFSPDDIRFKLKGTLIHEHPLFSFEYPLSFTLVDNQDDILLNMRITTVAFEHSARGVESLPKTNLSISVHEPGIWSDISSSAAIINIINYHNSDRNFTVIEKGSRTFGGKTANFIYYTYDQPAKEGFGYSPIPAFKGAVQFASFDYEGYVWRACLNCLEEEIPETSSYFQHVLDSFQISE
jgi:hypothetical protein